MRFESAKICSFDIDREAHVPTDIQSRTDGHLAAERRELGLDRPGLPHWWILLISGALADIAVTAVSLLAQ